MSIMQKIFEGVEVKGLLEQLKERPELWNRYTLRTKLMPDSPHREVDDIWLRYRDYSEFDINNPTAFAGNHKAIWYAAAEYLTIARAIINGLMTTVDGAELGGCLITRIPPGKQVYPHTDSGAWHSEYYAHKYLIALQSAPGQSFNFEGESHEAKAGDCFVFDNRPLHWVVNNSNIDRISLICAIRHKE